MNLELGQIAVFVVVGRAVVWCSLNDGRRRNFEAKDLGNKQWHVIRDKIRVSACGGIPSPNRQTMSLK